MHYNIWNVLLNISSNIEASSLLWINIAPADEVTLTQEHREMHREASYLF